ncbi:MAG: hypothetical protein WBA46_00960 [Thermomicrobiales bacterium]
MSEDIIIALIGSSVPLLLAIGGALAYLFKAQREAGRAEAYREASEATIKAKNEELDEARATIASRDRLIEELKETIRTLRLRSEATP